MTGTAIAPPTQLRYWNSAGTAPLAGGKVYFYEPDGSFTTAKDTFSDYEGNTANTNPVILDASGEALIRLSGRYDVKVFDASNVLQHSLQNYYGGDDSLLGYDGVAAFRSLTPANGQTYWLRYHTTEGDGGGGRFRGVSGAAAGTYTDDGGITIVPIGGDGSAAFVREFAGAVNVKWYGAVGDASTINTTAIQASINAQENKGNTDDGGAVYLPSGIYLTGALTLKDRVSIVGSGRGATIIKLANGTNANLLEVPAESNLLHIEHLTIDGNKANNTAGSGLVFADVSAKSGNSNAPYEDKLVATSNQFAYKHINVIDVTIGNCADDGVYIGPGNYQTFFDNFAISHNGRDGLACFASDCMFSNGYCEKNGRTGVYASGSNNKYVNIKAIWNGRTTNTYGGFREQGSSNLMINCEAQDNYCDGFIVLGASPIFLSCGSNTNGYKSVGSEDMSSRIHSNWVFGASASNVIVTGRSGNYLSAVGSDGFWVPEYPYYLNVPGTAQFLHFSIEYDGTKFNSEPNYHMELIANNASLGNLDFNSVNASDSFLDISPLSPDGVGDKTIRIFRESESAGASVIEIHEPGTSNSQHILNASTGEVQFSTQGVGDLIIVNSAWNNSMLRLGTYRLWVDATGDLRIKSGAPISDTDGTVVGTQT